MTNAANAVVLELGRRGVVIVSPDDPAGFTRALREAAGRAGRRVVFED